MRRMPLLLLPVLLPGLMLAACTTETAPEVAQAVATCDRAIDMMSGAYGMLLETGGEAERAAAIGAAKTAKETCREAQAVLSAKEMPNPPPEGGPCFGVAYMAERYADQALSAFKLKRPETDGFLRDDGEQYQAAREACPIGP